MPMDKQPLRGLIPLIFVIIGSLLFIVIGEQVFKVNPGMLAVYALFFVWTAFVISLMDRWPVQKRKQPVVGFIFLTAALIIGILHPVIIDTLGFGAAYYWPLISNLFLGIGIVIAFGNQIVAGLKQPKAFALNSLFMYVAAIVLLLAFGFVPAIWFAFFVFVFFWMETWPVANAKQPSKGIILFVIMGFFSLILEYLFEQVGTSFFQPDAGLWFVIWVWWLVTTSWTLETWPFKNMAQPGKAVAGLITTVVLTFVTYFVVLDVLNVGLAVAGSYVWIFVSWLYTWDIVFGKWPTERPAPASAETPKPAKGSEIGGKTAGGGVSP